MLDALWKRRPEFYPPPPFSLSVCLAKKNPSYYLYRQRRHTQALYGALWQCICTVWVYIGKKINHWNQDIFYTFLIRYMLLTNLTWSPYYFNFYIEPHFFFEIEKLLFMYAWLMVKSICVCWFDSAEFVKIRIV